jgi:hypothetical protein
MRYAQHKRGQKLHLVFEVEDGVLRRALCGKEAHWDLTINFPMGMACQNCERVFRSRKRKKMVIAL